MAEPLVVIGAGGFGREVVDVVEAVNAAAARPVWEVLGVADDGPSEVNLERLRRRAVPFLGPTTLLLEESFAAAYVIGIGSPQVRRLLAVRYAARRLRAATLVHPAATLGSEVSLGEGTVVCAGARLTTNIALGRHVHVNPNVTVGHDTTIGDYVSLNPACSISGDCRLGDEVLIGVGAVVLNQRTVGNGAVVGGAACVVRDVPGGVIVKGVPAR